jgi:hypothetical protein
MDPEAGIIVQFGNIGKVSLDDIHIPAQKLSYGGSPAELEHDFLDPWFFLIVIRVGFQLYNGFGDMPDITIRAVPHGLCPEFPFPEFLGIEIFQEMFRPVNLPEIKSIFAGLFVCQGDGEIVDNINRTDGKASVEHNVRMLPEIYRELDIMRCGRHSVMPFDIFVQVESPGPVIRGVLPSFRQGRLWFCMRIFHQGEKYEKAGWAVVKGPQYSFISDREHGDF